MPSGCTIPLGSNIPPQSAWASAVKDAWQRVLGWDQALSEIAERRYRRSPVRRPRVVLNAGGTRVHSQGSEAWGPMVLRGARHDSSERQRGDRRRTIKGVGITLGKIMFADSADNWFHADTILVWGANPAYTKYPQLPLPSPRRATNGRRVISISPDYNASAVQQRSLGAGEDRHGCPLLALAAAQIIVNGKMISSRRKISVARADRPAALAAARQRQNS